MNTIRLASRTVRVDCPGCIACWAMVFRAAECQDGYISGGLGPSRECVEVRTDRGKGHGTHN